MQKRRDSDLSRYPEPVRKLSQQLEKVEAAPSSPQQPVEKKNDKTKLRAEVAQLCEQLEMARRKIKAQGEVATAVQKRFKDCLGQIQAATQEKAQLTEDQNKRLAARNGELLELLRTERTQRESTLSCLQRALAETQRDLGTCAEALEVQVQRTDQEKRREQERAGLLEGRLRESEDENERLRERFRRQRGKRRGKDSGVVTFPGEVPEDGSRSSGAEEPDGVLRRLRESEVETMRELQADNTRLKEALERQTDAMAELQEDQEALVKRAVSEGQLVLEARLEGAEQETGLLRGRLQEVEDKERESAEAQRRFGDAFAKTRAKAEGMAATNQQLQELLEVERVERKQEMSVREREMSEREQEIAKSGQERSRTESYILQLQDELAVCGSKLEEEKLDLQRYVWRLEGTLKESEVKCVQLEQQISKLVASLEEKDHEVAASSKRLQDVFAASAAMDQIIQLLRESVLRLETDTSRQEEAAKEQAIRIAELEAEVDEAMLAKRDLEEQLRQEVEEQRSFSVNAQVEFNEALQAERKKSSEAEKLQKDQQEQLEQQQREQQVLLKELEDSRKGTELKDRALKDLQDFIRDASRSLSLGKEQLLKNTDVVGLENAEPTADVDTGPDSVLSQLQNVLAEMQTKLALCEQSLEEKTLRCVELDLKNQRVQEDVDSLRRTLQESEDKLSLAEGRTVHLQRSVDNDKEVIALLQKPKEVTSISTDTVETAESLGLLERENARLEEMLRQKDGRIVELEGEVDEAAGFKKYLEERLDQEIQRQKSLVAIGQAEARGAEVAQPGKRQRSDNAQKQRTDLQTQLNRAKADQLTLRQHLREAQRVSELRDQAVSDMQRCMNDTLSGMSVYSQERVELAEGRSTVLLSEIAGLQEQLERVTEDRDGTLWRLQKELAETQRKLSLCGDSLEEETFGRRDIEEGPVTQDDVTALKESLQQTESKTVQLERDNFYLKCALKDKELEVLALSQRLQESVETAGTDKAAQLESLRLLGSENLGFEVMLKEQTSRIIELEQKVAEAARAKRDLEKQLSRDIGRQISPSINIRVELGATEVALQNERRMSSEAEKLLGEEQVQTERPLIQQQLNDSEERTKLDPELQEYRGPVTTDRDAILSQTRMELADMQRKLSSCEEALEDRALRCRGLEDERLLMREDLGTLKGALEQTEDKCIQLEGYSLDLKCALERQEREARAAAESQGSKDVDGESLLGDLRKEAAEIRDKLSSCERLLEVKIRSCRELEDENSYVKEDLDILRGILQEAEERYLQSEQYNFSLKRTLEDKEQEVAALTSKSQEAAPTSNDPDETVAPADGSLRSWGSEGTGRGSPSKLADMQTKLSLCEEMLDEAARRCTDLEEEKLGLEQDADALRGMLREGQERQVQLERRNFDLECALDPKGGAAISQGLEEFLNDGRAPTRKGGLEGKSLTEALQERVKSKALPLFRQLEVVEELEEMGVQDMREVQYPFSSTLADSPPDNSKRALLVEKVGNQSASIDTDLQQILEPETPERERELSQLPRELAGALELLEMKIETCRNLEEQLDMLRKMLEASERQNVRLEICVQNLRGALDSGERKVIATSLKLHQALQSVSASERTIAQLEESVRRLQAENGELKAEAGRLVDKVRAGARQEAARGTRAERSQSEEWLSREVGRPTNEVRVEARQEVARGTRAEASQSEEWVSREVRRPANEVRVGGRQEAARGTRAEASQSEEWLSREAQKRTTAARKDVLQARVEMDKTLAQMKADMEQLSLRVQEEVGSCGLEEVKEDVFSALSEELSSLSDSFGQTIRRSLVEREVASSERDFF